MWIVRACALLVVRQLEPRTRRERGEEAGAKARRLLLGEAESMVSLELFRDLISLFESFSKTSRLASGRAMASAS